MGHHLYEDLLEISKVLLEYVLNSLDLLGVLDKFMNLPIAEVVN